MSGMKLILRTFSIVTLSVGFVVIGDGAFLLKRLGDHAFGDPNVFYGSLEHYAAITWTGVLMCLAACLGLALAADRMKGLRAARNTALIGLATPNDQTSLGPSNEASSSGRSKLITSAITPKPKEKSLREQLDCSQRCGRRRNSDADLPCNPSRLRKRRGENKGLMTQRGPNQLKRRRLS